MTRLVVRNLTSEDFEGLQLLAASTWVEHRSRLFAQPCIARHPDACTIALADGAPSGVALCFVRDRDAYCTILATGSTSLRSRVTSELVDKTVRAFLALGATTCWFAVDPADAAARRLCAMLGATELGSVQELATGAARIVSRIDRETLAQWCASRDQVRVAA